MNRSRRLVLLWGLVLPFALNGCSDGPTGPGAGNLTISVSGLPDGAAAAITVTGVGAFSRTVSGTETLTDVTPGAYTVVAANVSHSGASFAPLKPTQSLSIARGGQGSVDVTYVNLASSLSLGITGLPAGASGSVTVEGPNGFRETITSSQLLPGLVPGTYSVVVAGVVAGDSTYQSRPPIQDVLVTAEAPANVNIVYAAAGSSTLNLRIDGLYLTQSVQVYDRSIPLVAGRDAFLRVFALANQENSATPAVRVSVYHSGTLRNTLTIPAGSGSVVSSVQQGTLNRSWNVLVPGDLILPGAQISAVVDPTNGVAEANEGDNRYPSDGALLSLTLAEVPPLQIAFVPVLQSVNGLLGRVNPGNLESFLDVTRRLHPIGAIDAVVRTPYTTGAPELDRANSTGAWPTLLSELEALRVAEGSQRYYYGVVRTNYTSGFAGLAYVGGGDRGRQAAAIGWDFLPDASEVVAHELGHNWSRFHAPCDVPNPDPAYPYPGGAIGVHGYDVRSGRLYSPSTFDIMGYCDNPWISDYNYLGVMQHRATFDAATGSASVQPSLLVWGRVSDHELVLEPAFHLQTRPVLPQAGTAYRIEGIDANGSRIFGFAFDAVEVADTPGGERQFAFAIPLSASRMEQLAAIQLSDGRRVTIQRTRPVAEDARIAMASTPSGQVRVTWDAGAYPMAMIRDANSDQILSFARGGDIVLVSAAGRALEAFLSDGVRSVSRRMENPGLPALQR
jgi:hypothetical protein